MKELFWIEINSEGEQILGKYQNGSNHAPGYGMKVLIFVPAELNPKLRH
jgi:hypothetical protein